MFGCLCSLILSHSIANICQVFFRTAGVSYSVIWRMCFLKLLILTHTHTHTTVLRPFVRDYLGEPVPEETSIHSHPSCSSTILIIFLHLPRTLASSLLNPRTWQSLCTTSNHVLFGLPLGLEPTTSYCIHFFTQSLSSFCNTYTIVACFAVVATLCPLFLVSLSTPYLKLYLSTTCHTST